MWFDCLRCTRNTTGYVYLEIPSANSTVKPDIIGFSEDAKIEKPIGNIQAISVVK
jgi:hypothetical protein